MQHFFNFLHPVGQNALRPVHWPYAEAGLSKNLNTVKDYYSIRPFAVKSDHILARLLNNLGVPYNHSLERFYDIIDSRALALSSSFRMTSSINKGVMFKGNFFGEDSDEVLMATDDSFNPFYVFNNWKNVSAVKVLMHPKSDLGFTLANGKKSGTETGISVININIPMLAVQFKAFLKDQKENFIDKGLDSKTVAQFIHMYVLPNMLDSQLDLVLFNRCYNLVTGAPMGSAIRKHAFYLTDYAKQVDSTLNETIEYFRNNDKHYKIILKSFFAVTNTDFEKLFVLPDNAPTKQILWAELLARLKVIELLVKLSPNAGNKLNRSENNLFLRTLKLYENDGSLLNVMPRHVEHEVFYQIREIKKLIA